MTTITYSRSEFTNGFCLATADAKSEEEKRMYEFRKAHHDEIRAEEERHTEILRTAEDVLKNTTFEQQLFKDEDKFSLFSVLDVKDYKDSVVSIALFHGDKMLFACSGIALPRGRERLRVARFVTSARFSTEFNNHRSKDDKLSIQVRLPDNIITDGFLGLYDDDIAIVSALLSYVHPVDLDLSTERKCDMLAGRDMLMLAGRAADSSATLMVTGFVVEYDDDIVIQGQKRRQKRRRDPHGSILSSVGCDITEAALGGPVIAFRRGHKPLEFLAGLIISCDCEFNAAYYLPTKDLCQRLKHFQILTDKAINFRGYRLPSKVNCVIPSGFWVSVRRFISLGYPPPPPLVCELNGTLVNMFEEDFGRLLAWEGYPFGVSQRGYGKDVWEELPTEVVMNVSRSVVSLASFKGDVRCFACTGLLIKWHGSQGTQDVILTSASLVRTNGDKIDEKLSIRVFLPPKQIVKGKLELYHQNYNIAIVSVASCLGDISPQDIWTPLTNPKSPEVVVAIGRNPSKGLLMASKGKLGPPSKRCELKCKALKLSTCQIKKAGIGGPLINAENGNFLGMNFYDGSKTTPFLPSEIIVNVLKLARDLPFNRNRPISLMNTVGKKNWWPVPEAYWYHADLDDESVLPEHVGKVRQ